MHDHGDDEKEKTGAKSLREFECPTCNAHNPYDDGFSAGDEVRCFYCGAEFRVHVDEMSGKVRYKEI
jgi:transcription elongation factor Elf1